MIGASGSNIDSISSLDAVWATAMKIALHARNKMCFVDGTCTKAAYVTSVVFSNQWERCNVVVLSWLLSSIYDDLYLSQVYSENAVEVWKELKETHDKLDESILFNLMMKINNFKQNGLPVYEYYHKLNSLSGEFDILTKLAPCTCDAKTELSKHNQLMKLMQFLMGLDDVYLPIRSSLLTQNELPDVKDAFVSVCREESHRGLGSGHTIDRCFELIGYPNGFKRNQNGKSSSNNKSNSSNNVNVQKNSSGMPFTSDQIAKLMSLRGDKSGNEIHANITGANQHIASSTNNMTNVIDISELNITVGHPNGTTGKIRKDLKRENVLGTGSEAGGLYVLGHPLDQVLYVLKNRLSIGDLIHLDLWGPYKVTPRDGFSQVSSPNDDGGEPSGSNIGSKSKSDDTAKEQSSDDDQESVYIGEEDFSKGNVFENNDVPTHLFNTGESSTLRSLVASQNCLLNLMIMCLIVRLDMAMNEEMEVLYENNTWVLVELPRNRKAIRSKWVYKIKHKSTGEIDRYKARLVAKGFNQKEGIDYEETFSPVVKMGTVRCLISLAIQNGWCLFQLDVNNTFYMAPRQWNNRLSEALIENDFKQSGHDHSLYTKESGGSFVALLVYVDDIVLTGNDINEINKVKTSLRSKFKIKDLGELKYCLGIECLSQYMHAPLQSHMNLRLRVLKYLKGAPGSGVNYEKSEHIKKQATLSKSSAEAKYRLMAAATCEVMWVVNILKDLKVTNLLPAELFCDNNAAIQIAANLVMHEKTKHFDLDVHIIKEKVASDSFTDYLNRLLAEPNEPPVVCLITDAEYYFAQEVADSMKVPRLVTWACTIASVLVYGDLLYFYEKGPATYVFPCVATPSSGLDQDRTFFAWLDRQASKSVLYMSFGSVARLSRLEFLEVAYALANIDFPFLWVVRPRWVEGSEWIELLPDKFLEEWMEFNIGCERVPIICSPCAVGQPIIARYVSDVWKIGVLLEDGVERVGIERAIKRVMEDKEGEEIRERISCVKKDTAISFDDGGSSHQSLKKLVDYVSSFSLGSTNLL
ncbi:ribonuclease H-like domain-containing protein [Tanacetum coccineum]